MKSRKPHLVATSFTLCYAVLTGLAYLPTFFSTDAFAFIFVIVVTLPWSIIMTFVFDAIDPTLMDNPRVSDIFFPVAALVNAILIYLVVYAMNRTIVRSGD